MTLFDLPEEASRAPLAGPLVRVRLLVAYDGSGFHGFAPQPGVRTVASAIAEVVEHVVGHPVELTCAGRTDRGVHAWGQVVTFDARPERADPEVLARAITKRCGPEIVVRAADLVDPGFDARFSARARTYRYTVLNRPVPDPFLARTTWHVPEPLDLELLRLACDPFLGEHDFSAFCRRPKAAKAPRGTGTPGSSGAPEASTGATATGGPDGAPAPEVSLVRRVLHAGWTDLGDGLLRFEIRATAFCHQMVRSIVGTVVAAGRGQLRPGEIRGILASRDRGRAAPIAPPQGLCLYHVDYGDDELRPAADQP